MNNNAKQTSQNQEVTGNNQLVVSRCTGFLLALSLS